MAHGEIESEVGHNTDLESFIMSSVTAGHEIESEVSAWIPIFFLETRRDLAH